MDKKFIVAEKMESSDNENSIVGWASKPTIDRDKELILADAWNLDNYRKNPVVMLFHQYSQLPIGKCLWIKSTDSGLRFKCKFANSERGKEVYDLYKNQFLNAFSVGFKPRPGGVVDNPTETKYKGVKRLFTDVELMEISCVPIPAHSDALVEQSSFIKYVKDGNIITKQLKDELEAIIEIIEKSDDTLEIEVKSTDPETNTEIKIEETDNFVHVPAPGEEGKHKDCKIRTISISKKDGIQAKYCIDDKVVIGYMFDKKNNKWTKESAVKWVEDHKKELVFEVPEDETMPYSIKSEDAIWDEDGDIAFVETKAVTPEADEAEKDFMTRCMGDKSMAKLNEGFRTNMCKLAWKKNAAKSEEDLVEKKLSDPMEDESLEDYIKRFMSDERMVSEYPKEEDRTAAAMSTWEKCSGKKKEPEPDAVITKQEQVDEFLLRILPEKTFEIKTAEELAQVFEKASGYDDMKGTVSAMESQIGSMEPIGHPVVSDQEKSADAEGNPSLYDLTGAVDRALNPMRNQNTDIPSPIYESKIPYRAVIDIFAVNYPSGHVVYSEYDRVAGQSKYFQIGYEYDLKMRVATIVGEPEEVLQSWVTERYMIEKDADVEQKDEEEIETKSGRMISAKNKKLIQECCSRMDEAKGALEALIAVEEEIEDEEKDEEDIEQKDAVEPEEEFELIEKEPETIELEESVVPEVKADDNILEIDENMIKDVIASVMSKNSAKIDTKGISEQVVAKLMGRATLK